MLAQDFDKPIRRRLRRHEAEIPAVPADQIDHARMVDEIVAGLLVLDLGIERLERIGANAFKAFYAKVKDEKTGDYFIDHTGVIYLIGRDGRYLGFMPPQTTPDRLVEILRKHLAP